MKQTKLRPKIKQELFENDIYQGRYEPSKKEKEDKYPKRYLEEILDGEILEEDYSKGYKEW